jgi:hypothetical protein
MSDDEDFEFEIEVEQLRAELAEVRIQAGKTYEQVDVETRDELQAIREELTEERALSKALDDLCMAYRLRRAPLGKVLDTIDKIKAKRAASDAVRSKT